MNDPYATLGVGRTASEEEISAAFKKLARRYHPDLHPGDKEAEAKFKEVSAAADLLRDKEKRRRFDAGEIDASGAERAAYPGDTAQHAAADGFADNEELAEFLARAFAQGHGRGGGEGFRARGQDVSYELRLPFLEAVRGGSHRLDLPDGKSLQVTIPAGSANGRTLRLRGQGRPGYGGGPAGDAYVELRVGPHAYFRRKDDDIHIEVPVTLKEAVLGARIDVPTIDGKVSLAVPKGSNAGTTLRLRERGVLDPKTGQRGHQFVTLRIVLPKAEDKGLAELVEKWAPERAENPREEMLR